MTISKVTTNNKMTFADALQAPAKWGARQYTNLTAKIDAKGVKKVAIAALRVLALIPATLAVVFGAIPYAIGALLKGRAKPASAPKKPMPTPVDTRPAVQRKFDPAFLNRIAGQNGGRGGAPRKPARTNRAPATPSKFKKPAGTPDHSNLLAEIQKGKKLNHVTTTSSTASAGRVVATQPRPAAARHMPKNRGPAAGYGLGVENNAMFKRLAAENA